LQYSHASNTQSNSFSADYVPVASVLLPSADYAPVAPNLPATLSDFAAYLGASGASSQPQKADYPQKHFTGSQEVSLLGPTSGALPTAIDLKLRSIFMKYAKEGRIENIQLSEMLHRHRPQGRIDSNSLEPLSRILFASSHTVDYEGFAVYFQICKRCSEAKRAEFQQVFATSNTQFSC
jgi:hypothetical protein